MIRHKRFVREVIKFCSFAARTSCHLVTWFNVLILAELEGEGKFISFLNVCCYIRNLFYQETYQSHWCKRPSGSRCCCRVGRHLQRQQGEKKEREESQLVTLHNTLLKHLYANIYTEPLEIKGRLSKSHAQECEM